MDGNELSIGGEQQQAAEDDAQFPGLESSPTRTAYLSDGVYLLGLVVAMISTCLSAFGSTTLITLMLRHRQTLLYKSLSNRLVFGMRVLDLVVCLSLVLQSFLVRHDSEILTAVGTRQSCEAVGFLFLFYIGVSS